MTRPLLDESLGDLYEGYYDDGVVKAKRRISANDSVRELERIIGDQSFHHALDVGAGDGAVLQAAQRIDRIESFSAVEISQSGVDAIRERNICRLESVDLFDGYHIQCDDGEFDLAFSIYVLEHVEHERLFLREMSRVASNVVVAVPLEHTIRIGKARRVGKAIGHLNFYTLDTFANTLETAGLEILKLSCYATSAEYEKFVAPKLGWLKYGVRTTSLTLMPRVTRALLNTMAIALCKNRE